MTRWASLDALLKGSRRRRGRRASLGRGRGARAQVIAPDDAWGCSTTRRAASAAGRASRRARRRTGCRRDSRARPTPLRRADRPQPTRRKTVIKRWIDAADKRSFVKAQCMHCVDPPASRPASAPEGGHCTRGREKGTGIVAYDSDLRRVPLLPDRLPVQRPEVRVGKAAAADREVRAVPATRRPRSRAHSRWPKPALQCRSARAKAVVYGKRCELLSRAKRRLAPSRRSTRPKSTARTTAAARRCSISVARAVREARTAEASRSRRRHSRRASRIRRVYRGCHARRAVRALAFVIGAGTGSDGSGKAEREEEGEQMSAHGHAGRRRARCSPPVMAVLLATSAVRR